MQSDRYNCWDGWQHFRKDRLFNISMVHCNVRAYNFREISVFFKSRLEVDKYQGKQILLRLHSSWPAHQTPSKMSLHLTEKLFPREQILSCKSWHLLSGNIIIFNSVASPSDVYILHYVFAGMLQRGQIFTMSLTRIPSWSSGRKNMKICSTTEKTCYDHLTWISRNGTKQSSDVQHL